MGHAHEIKFQQDTIQQKYPGGQITDTEGKWFVGDLATAQVPAGELLRLGGRTANPSDAVSCADRIRAGRGARCAQQRALHGPGAAPGLRDAAG